MIVCCGEALIDMIQTPVDGLGAVFFPTPGGCPYNTAIAIGRLGAPVQFLGRCSNDFFGDIVVKRLRDNQVGDDLIIRCKNNTTLAFIKVEEDKEPQYAFYTEGTADRSLSAEDLPSPLPPSTSCIVFGSISMTMEPLASTIESLIAQVNTQMKPVIAFDPNIRPIMIPNRDAYMERFKKWAGASTMAKISAEDFEFLCPGIEPEQALRTILDLGTMLAICTLGPQGAIAMLRRNDGCITVVSAPAIPVSRIVDTVGAGDTFHGAFLAWLELRGKMSHAALAALSEADLRDALAFANKAASIACSRHGAEPPTWEEAERLSAS